MPKDAGKTAQNILITLGVVTAVVLVGAVGYLLWKGEQAGDDGGPATLGGLVGNLIDNAAGIWGQASSLFGNAGKNAANRSLDG